MIALIRRALVAAITPPPVPTADAPGLVRVKSYTRKPPVNAKRQALHDQLRAEMSRPAGQRVAS